MSNQHTGERGVPDPEAVREEAERLVAAGLAAVSMVADRIGAPTRERGGSVAAGYDAIGDVLFGPAGHRRHNVANDSPECCRCPVCRVISAAREPNPNVAERLATGVGTVAEGTARVLRGLAGAAGTVFESRPRSGDAPPRSAPPAGARKDTRDTDPWAAATAEPAAPPSAPGAAPAPVEPPVQQPPATAAATEAAGETEPPGKKVQTAPPRKVAKKAVKKTAVKKAPAKTAAPKPAPGEAGQ